MNIEYILEAVISIIAAMVLHEVAHGYVAYLLGDDTAQVEGRLTLNPLKHIDPIMTVLMPLIMISFGAPPIGAAKPVPYNPNSLRFKDIGIVLVSLAGPFTNLLLGIAAGLLIRFNVVPSFVDQILYLFTIINLSFFLFNIIPFPPLDGSRILYVVAPDAAKEMMERIEGSGPVGLLAFLLIFYLFLITPFSLLLQHSLTFLIG